MKLKIQFLWYQTEIMILNDLKSTSLTSNSSVSDSGSFGCIYFLKSLSETISIKSIEIGTDEK